MDFAASSDHGMKIKENEQINEYLNLATKQKQQQQKTVEQENDGDTSCNWCTWNDPLSPVEKAGRGRCQRKNRDHSNNSIALDRLDYWK